MGASEKYKAMIKELDSGIIQFIIDDIKKSDLWPTCQQFKDIQCKMDKGVNPNWIIARILDEAQDRNLLSNQEHDYLSR